MLLSAPNLIPVPSVHFPNKWAQLRTIHPSSCPVVFNTRPPKSPHLSTCTAGQLRVNSLHPGPSSTGAALSNGISGLGHSCPTKGAALPPSMAAQELAGSAGTKANHYWPSKSQGLSGQHSCRLELNGTKIGKVSAKEDGMLCTQLCFRGSPPQPMATNAVLTKWLCTTRAPYLLYLPACSHLFHKLWGSSPRASTEAAGSPPNCAQQHTRTHMPLTFAFCLMQAWAGSTQQSGSAMQGGDSLQSFWPRGSTGGKTCSVRMGSHAVAAWGAPRGGWFPCAEATHELADPRAFRGDQRVSTPSRQTPTHRFPFIPH